MINQHDVFEIKKKLNDNLNTLQILYDYAVAELKIALRGKTLPNDNMEISKIAKKADNLDIVGKKAITLYSYKVNEAKRSLNEYLNNSLAIDRLNNEINIITLGGGKLVKKTNALLAKKAKQDALFENATRRIYEVNDLTDLISKGILIIDNKGRYTTWKLGKLDLDRDLQDVVHSRQNNIQVTVASAAAKLPNITTFPNVMVSVDTVANANQTANVVTNANQTANVVTNANQTANAVANANQTAMDTESEDEASTSSRKKKH